jgi:hypothetical protein
LSADQELWRRSGEGFLSLNAYGAIVDGRSVALSGADGSIDWWCVPDINSPPLFDRLLDAANGGFFSITPSEPCGIDVGTKQELYQLLRRLADQGAAIVFYSTDYDGLIGCCDRVLELYEGRIKKELVGSAITEQNLIANALDLPVGQIAPSTGEAR